MSNIHSVESLWLETAVASLENLKLLDENPHRASLHTPCYLSCEVNELSFEMYLESNNL